MKSNDEMFDISDEFTKSLEKLVEEETNVAKAYVKNNGDAIAKQTDGKQESSDISNTQMFDSEELKKNVGGVNISDLLDESEELNISSSRKMPPQTSQTKVRSAEKKAETRKNTIIIVAVITVVTVAVVGIILGALALSNKNKNSYAFNMEQAKGYYESGDYSTALNYYNVAYGTVEGKKDTDLMYKMYECYKNTKDTVMAKNMLDDIISYDKYNEAAIKALGHHYRDNGSGAALNSMLAQYRGTRAGEFIKEFEIAVPTTSETPGEFSSAIKLSLIAGAGCSIYYTLDGSTPTTASNLYSGEIIIDKNVVVKTIAVDSIGVESVVAEYEYKINYVTPDGPVLSVESGLTIDTDTVLRITNLKDGDTAYYTVDGTTPTTSSYKYEDGIKLEKGSFIVSLVIISATGDTSKITRYTYIVNEVKIYTYEECVDILKERMKGLNILSEDGKTTTGGDKVSFLYESKQTIDEAEMYIIEYIVKPSSGTGTKGYYGVSTKGGSCYKITISDGKYSAVKY